jgi:hypothetical protein
MATARGSSLLGGLVDGGKSASKFAPDRFRGTIMAQLGMAAQNKWTVEWPKINNMKFPVSGSTRDFSNSEDKNLLCTAAGLPGKQIQTTQRIMGAESVPVAVGHTMPEVSFSYYLTNSYEMRQYFQEWMNAITHQPGKGGKEHDKPAFAGYFREYCKDVKIRQYTRDGRRVYDAKLHDAFPTALSTIELNNQLQSAAHEFTVSIAYRTYSNDAQKS